MGATARLAFNALEASSIGSETEGGTLADMPYEDRSQGQSLVDKDGALYDPKQYDGGGGGIFALSERNVNRSVPVAAPSALAGVLVDEAADEADDEAMPALEESDDEEPLGPRTEDMPMTALPPQCRTAYGLLYELPSERYARSSHLLPRMFDYRLYGWSIRRNREGL